MLLSVQNYQFVCWLQLIFVPFKLRLVGCRSRPIWPLLVGESSCRLVGARGGESEGETKSHLVGYHISRPPSPSLSPPSIPQRVRLVDPGCVPERERRGRGNRIGRHRRCRPPLMSRLKRDTPIRYNFGLSSTIGR